MLPWFLCADVSVIVSLWYAAVHGGEGQSFGHQPKPNPLHCRAEHHYPLKSSETDRGVIIHLNDSIHVIDDTIHS